MILTIIITAILLIGIIIFILFYRLAKKYGSMPIYLNSYKLLKNKIPEEIALKESFKPFLYRKPFNILNENDVELIIITLEPLKSLRPGLIALLILICDKKNDVSFLRDSKKIIEELIGFYLHKKSKSHEILNALILHYNEKYKRRCV